MPKAFPDHYALKPLCFKTISFQYQYESKTSMIKNYSVYVFKSIVLQNHQAQHYYVSKPFCFINHNVAKPYVSKPSCFKTILFHNRYVSEPFCFKNTLVLGHRSNGRLIN